MRASRTVDGSSRTGDPAEIAVSGDAAERTGDRSGPAAAQVGALIAARRRERGLTLAQVAEAAELSPAYISQIEAGAANPTLGTLGRVTEALRTDLLSLLAGAAAGPAPDGFAPALRPRPVDPSDSRQGRVWDLAAPGSRLLAPRLVARRAGDHAADVTHDGEELVTVLCGSYRIVLDGVASDLVAGDSVHYDATRPHRLQARSDDARCLVVFTAN